MQKLRSSYFPHTMSWGYNMSLKLHFLQSHLEFFAGNMGFVSNEDGEKLPQDISRMEKRYSSKWTPNMLADYCWMLLRETPREEYKRQKMTE